MSKRTVWVIEQGSYSDYRVVGIYSTRENAQEIADIINREDPYDKAEVGEWEVDPLISELRAGWRPFHLVMLADGTVENVRDEERNSYNIGNGTHLWLWERTKAPAYKGKGIPDALNGTVWAKDREHAIKIANERRVQMIASGEWKP